MIQAEYFKTLTTDHLLSMRQDRYSDYPSIEGGEKVKLYYEPAHAEYVYGHYFDKDALLAELATRPHRVRAKDRRKKK